MNTVTVEEHELVIAPWGINKILGFRSGLRVPLTHVQSARVDTSIAGRGAGLRLLGTSLPGKHVGTFFKDKRHSYWNVSHQSNNIVVELVQEGFDYVVLTVRSPQHVASEITDALRV